MKISRRYTLAASDLQNKTLLTSALKSTLTVPISPLQNKRRHTLTTAAILNSARKAVDQAHKVAEQQKRRRSVGQMEGPCEDGAVTEGPERRTPLKPTNFRAFPKENEERAASTPEGNLSIKSFIQKIINCVPCNVTFLPEMHKIPYNQECDGALNMHSFIHISGKLNFEI